MTSLFHDIIFGPVHSRRLGLSLGVNLLPTDSKLCSFDCIYCECGWNAEHPGGRRFNAREDVRTQLEATLRRMVADGTPPDGLSMDAEYAFYPAETDCVRLTIRYRGDSTVYFGTDYTVCRFQNGRWETLPGADAWNSLLIGIGRPQFPVPGDARQTKEYAYGFTARLAPRVYPSVYARYRICKNVYMENPHRNYLLTADFTVTPFVPFTRFPEQTGDNN